MFHFQLTLGSLAITLTTVLHPTTTFFVMGAQAQTHDMVHMGDSEHPHKYIAGPPTEIDCSSSINNFEYYIERCYDEITQWWANGHCIDGVKTEVSELHRCQRKDGSRPYCHDCHAGQGANMKNIKHVCGSDSSDPNFVCPVALSSDPAQYCPDEQLRTTAYSHQCTSQTTSSYLHESFYCDEEKVYSDGPESYTCGREWYWSYKKGDLEDSLLAAHPELDGKEHPFSTDDDKYCLECGMNIQVCVSDPEATCIDLGLPMRGFNELPAKSSNSRYEGGER